MVADSEDAGLRRRNAEKSDEAILRQLGKDPQQSRSDLAAALDVPLPWLTSRIQALYARNAIQIRPVLNVNKAGRSFVFCKLAINALGFDRTLHKLAEYPEFVTVASIIGGKYNAYVYFTYSDMDDLHYIIKNIVMKIDGLSELETSVISGSLIYNPQYFNYQGSFLQPQVADNAETLRKEAAKCHLDELDIAIISELQCNPGKSLRAIARERDISPGTVRYRLQRLEGDEIIQFVALTDARELSLSCFTILELRIDPAASAAVVRQLSGKPWLAHLQEVVGASDLIAFVNARDLQEAQALIANEVRSVPGIRAVGVRIIIDTYKLDPRWGFLKAKA